MYLLKLDEKSGALTVDEAFRGAGWQDRVQFRQAVMAARLDWRRQAAWCGVLALITSPSPFDRSFKNGSATMAAFPPISDIDEVD